MSYSDTVSTLKTLGPKGEVPQCRMENADSVRDFVARVIEADVKRARKRGLVAGLVDGNPPYNPGKLREQNRADACNVNWGTARSTLEASTGAFYDLATQAPGIAQVVTSFGNEENQVEWSRILSKEVDLVFRQEKSWDSQEQTSQTEMVLYGYGPLFFEDAHVVFPRAIEAQNLVVPDRTPSDVSRWEIAVILFEYFPPELYQFIENEEAAEAVGWDVAYTKSVIENAVDQKSQETRVRTWEWYQNEIKTNSFNYLDNISVCKLAHVFWREFPKNGEQSGRITHSIILRDDSTDLGIKYLFLHVGRYENFYNAIHPIYYDKGRGGLHYNVTGLGVKQYGPLEYENRLLCGLMDAANAPKILFKPTSSEAATKFQLARFGQWGLLPANTDVVQTPIQGLMQDGLAMFRTSSELMRSNLSQYRQTVPMEQPGNPSTATEIQMNASRSSSLSNTTFSRYYNQRDLLLEEIVRRLCNLNSTDKRAIAFQKRCTDQGVPRECFGRIESVEAVRVIGQGSPFMRQQVTQALLPTIQRLPETGQMNLMDDYIASHAGQSAVNRYNPRSRNSILLGDQRERAMNQINNAKNGIPPVISQTQNPVIFCGLYIAAATQAIASVQQGADPMGVIQFLENIGPAIQGQLGRITGDPLRSQAHALLEEQASEVGRQTDQLISMVKQQMQQQQGQQQKTETVLSDLQLKQLETAAKIKDRSVKTAASLQDKAIKSKHSMAMQSAKTRQELALSDARAASDITIQTKKAQAEANEPEPATVGE